MTIQDKNMALERYARGKEKELIEMYIANGPAETKKGIGVSEEEWRVVFDYLVFEKNLLYKAVIASADFFNQEYVKNGMTRVREILDVVDAKYDQMATLVFDFVAIANEGLYFHVLEHRDKYMNVMRQRGGDFVRKVLGVWGEKYEENWAKVLDFLLKGVCDDIFTEQTFDHGLRAFSRIMNCKREQRPIYKSGIII